MNRLPHIGKLLRSNGTQSTIRLYSDTVKAEKSINSVQLLGRVGNDPSQRGTEAHPVVLFSLATSSSYRNENNEFVTKTDWHRICVFKPNLRDSVFNYLQKGQRVYVTGKISYADYKDDNGVVTSTTSIIADDVIFFQKS